MNGRGVMVKTHSVCSRCPLESTAKAVVDLDGSAWDKRTDEIVPKYTCVIALRGATWTVGLPGRPFRREC